MSDVLTANDVEYLRSLRKRGFAVTVWTPAELEMLDEDMTIEDLEDAMCEYASNFLTVENDDSEV